MKRLNKQITKQVVNSDTGELTTVETEKHFNIPVTNDNFFMVYTDYLHKFYGLQHLSDVKLITKFCEMAEFNTGKVVLSSAERDGLCNELGISKPNLSKNIKRLKDATLITGGKGSYYISPNVFWKGDRKERAALLKGDGLTVTLTFKSTDEHKEK